MLSTYYVLGTLHTPLYPLHNPGAGVMDRALTTASL